jgi:hypothetical protein
MTFASLTAHRPRTRTIPALGLTAMAILGSACAGPPKVIDAAPAGSVTTYVAPTTTTPPTTVGAYTPTPADFQIEIIETERSCFGSAGCNVGYKINPTYTGAQHADPKRTFTVIYEITGGDDPKTANFTLTGEKWQQFGSQAHISTPTNPTLAATVTRVVAD